MQEKLNTSFFDKYLGRITTLKAIHIIVIVGILVFFNGLFNDFVRDDSFQIVNNPLIQNLSNIFSFFSGGTFYAGVNKALTGVYYKPVTLTVFSLIYTFFGSSSFWFHLFQLLFHISSSVILFLIFRNFFKPKIALILSLVFLVHPINSETVFYISNLQDVLFLFFGVASLWLVINYKSDKQLLFTGFFLFLSLLSKETGILFIFISIIYVLFYNKNLVIKLPSVLFLITFFYIFLRVVTVGIFSSPLNAPIDKLSLLERAINIPSIIFLYIKNFIFPLNLSSSYQFAYTQMTFDNFILPLLFDVLFIIFFSYLAFFIYNKYSKTYFKTYIFFVIWFILGILLHLQILPLDSTAADRWFYFPIIGLLGMLGILIDNFNLNKKNELLIFLILGLILLLSGRTMIRSFDWRNNFNLAMHDIKVSKDSYDLENIIGIGYFQQGKVNEARTHVEKSVKLYPYLTNNNVLGLIYQTLGDYPKAKKYYFSALKYGDHYSVYDNIALLGLIAKEQPEANIRFVLSGLKKYPNDSVLWLSLAILQYENNSTHSAKTAITNAYTLRKDATTTDVYNKIMNGFPLNLNLKNF